MNIPFPFRALRWLPLGLLLTGTLSCAHAQRRAASRRPMLAPYQTEKFRLSPSPCVPTGYPARIDDARFINSRGGSFPLPYGHLLKSAWGISSIGWAVGDDLQAVPDSLELRWFSYTEDKFYEGHFLLPQEKIYTLLKAGYWNPETRRQDTYGSIIVCLAPTGVVYMWLSSGSTKVLIGRYQARQIEYDFNVFNRGRVDRALVVSQTRGELPEAVLAEIKAGTISAAKWDNYLKRYPWKLEFSRPLTLTTFAIGYRNAEVTGDPLTPDMAAYAQLILAPSPKPVPQRTSLYLAGDYGRKSLLKISPFDEAETMGAFQTLAAKHPGQVITLHVEIDEKMTKATLSLRAGGQSLPLTKSPIKFFDLTK